ncbi:VCBS repeat-containing protein [bacterium]|nr:VCBS repeat-containing protein [bacterium]
MKKYIRTLLFVLICSLTSHLAVAQPLFSPSMVQIPITSPQDVAFADFDENGYTDIAVMASGGVTIFMMESSGWYSKSELGYYGFSIAIADFDNDDNFDILINNTSDSLVPILFGDGNGFFSSPVENNYAVLWGITGDNPRLGGIGFIDDDNFPDLVYGDKDHTVILLGNGDGTFAVSDTLPVSVAYTFYERYALLEDFNEDGDVDIILPPYWAPGSVLFDSITVFLNDGEGKFSEGTPYPVGVLSLDLDVGDFDNDEHLDIISGNDDPAGVIFLKGNGDGSFASPEPTYSVESINSLHPLHLDSDSFLDLVVYYYTFSKLGFLRGNGDGTFSEPHWLPWPGWITYLDYIPDVLTSNDINHDGQQDIILPAWGIDIGTIDILHGDGEGFVQVPQQYEVGHNPSSVASADFNNDLHTDLVVGNTGSGFLNVLLNDGFGDFSIRSCETLVSISPVLVIAAYLDYDEFEDIVYTAVDTPNTGVFNLFNDGTAEFVGSSFFTIDGYPRKLVKGDFDEDNREDVVTFSIQQIVVVRAGGALRDYYTLSDDITSIAVGDFNEDEHLDVVANLSTSSFSILLGEGTGEFRNGMTYSTSVWGGQNIDVADFNNDYHDDVVAWGYNGGEVWLGDGTGNMELQWSTDISFWNDNIVVSDFSGDGLIDIAIGDEAISIFIGDGEGNFELGQYSYVYCFEPGALCPGDFDNDGSIDLAIAYPDTNLISILFGTMSITHDVAVLSIIAPVGDIYVGESVEPKAVIANLRAETETFAVYFTIDYYYSDTVFDITLEGGDRDTLTFEQWIPSSGRAYHTTCGIVFPEDENTSNNIQNGIFHAYVSSDPRIHSITPAYAGNTGWITTLIHGENFEDSATVKLVKDGEEDIIASSYPTQFTEVYSDTLMQAVFDLDEARLGVWDLVVTNPGGESGTLENAFIIETGEQHLWVDINGMTEVLILNEIDVPVSYVVYAGNSGNINLLNVILELDVPLWLDVTSIVDVETGDTLLYGDSLEAYDMVAGVVPFWITTLQPGEVKTYEVNANTNHAEYPNFDRSKGAQDDIPSLDFSGSLLGGLKCFGKNLWEAYTQHDGLTQQDFERATEQAVNEVISGLFWTAVKVSVQILFPATIPFIQAYDLATSVVGYAQDAAQLARLASSTLRILLGSFLDPNHKVGPTGFGDEGYITGDRQFQYTIYFQNADSVTFAVPDVVVIDTLDPYLDWATLRFIDSKHTITRMEFDTTSGYGIATFYFEGIYLPPDTIPPNGQSWFTYSIFPDSNLITGTQITNRASIIFRDSTAEAEPIITNTTLNTIDNITPSSEVEELPETIDSLVFLVSWHGSDSGSGIFRYNVYVSVNSGEYVFWLNTPDTCAFYTGFNDSTYSFYSIAIDNVGHIENPPEEADATTRIDADIFEDAVQINPNPFVPSRGHTIITFFGGNLFDSKIRIYNKAGILVRTLDEEDGKSTLEWDVTNEEGNKLASGVYIWYLTGPSGEEKGKFAIIK